MPQSAPTNSLTPTPTSRKKKHSKHNDSRRNHRRRRTEQSNDDRWPRSPTLIALSVILMAVINVYSAETGPIRVFDNTPRGNEEFHQSEETPPGGLRAQLPKRVSSQTRMRDAMKELKNNPSSSFEKRKGTTSKNIEARKPIDRVKNVAIQKPISYAVNVENTNPVMNVETRKKIAANAEKRNQHNQAKASAAGNRKQINQAIAAQAEKRRQMNNPQSNSASTMDFASKYKDNPTATALSEAVSAAKARENTAQDDDDDDDDDAGNGKEVRQPDQPSNGNTMNFVSKYKDSLNAKALADAVEKAKKKESAN